MTLRLSMIAAMADQYRGLLAQWNGHLLVEDHRTGREYVVGPGDIVDLAESVVIISWRGDSPTGVILPLGDVTISQHDPDTGPAAVTTARKVKDSAAKG